MNASFWQPLASDDSLNEDIWRTSPALQQEIQPAADARSSGIGAQQAMLLPDRPLPWVPDIVGTNWRQPDALAIVGSAYAPFVQGSAGRSNAMPISRYAGAASWQEFQQGFIGSVVDRDSSYYGPLASLAATTSTPDNCSALALFDLCRVSFVERDSSGTFKGGDGVVGRHCSLFERYVEHPHNQSWLWHRLISTEATRIVALGTIAEHGLLRLFARQRCELRLAGSDKRLAQSDSGLWVKKYASADNKLTFWTDAGAWWDIRGASQGQTRRWRLLPVLHPSARGRTGRYEQERDLLTRMLSD